MAPPDVPHEPQTRSRATFARATWFWTKVALCLVLIDLLLFDAGWFWHVELEPSPWGGVYKIVRTIEVHPADRPAAIAVGSSVVRSAAVPPPIERQMRRSGVPGSFYNFGYDGTHVTDAAVVADAAGEMTPWLVVYGATARDFKPNEARSMLASQFIDFSVPLAHVAPDSIDEWISRLAKEHWQLYRNRRLVRLVMDQKLGHLARAIPRSAWAARSESRVPARRARPRKHRFTSQFRASPSHPAWTKWNHTRDPSDYVAYLETRGVVLERYREFVDQERDPESSPEVASLRWLLRNCRERGTRVLVVYFPENPIFRQPALSAWYSPETSDRTAALLEREAERYDARFVDLRDALPTEDFVDLIHLNLAGNARMAQILARLVAEEWREAVSSAATTGGIPP